MGKSKKNNADASESHDASKAGKKAEKARVKFERKEAKLKREKMAAELVMWDVELDLLALYAEHADEEKRAVYEDKIAELQEHLENAYTQFKMLKKIKKLDSPAELISSIQPVWSETETAFAGVEETLDQARPEVPAVITAAATE